MLKVRTSFKLRAERTDYVSPCGHQEKDVVLVMRAVDGSQQYFQAEGLVEGLEYDLYAEPAPTN